MTKPVEESTTKTPDLCDGHQPVEKLIFTLPRVPPTPAPWIPLKEPQEKLRSLFSFDIGGAPFVRKVFIDAYLNFTITTRSDAPGSATDWNRIEGAVVSKLPVASGGPPLAEIVRLSDRAYHGKEPRAERKASFRLNAEVLVPANQTSTPWWCEVQFAHEGNSYIRFEEDGPAGSSRLVFTHFIESHAMRIQMRSAPRTEE